MNKHTSLPIKLTHMLCDLHEFLNTEPTGGAYEDLIDEADKAVGRLILEFEQDGKRRWITMDQAKDTRSK